MLSHFRLRILLATREEAGSNWLQYEGLYLVNAKNLRVRLASGNMAGSTSQGYQDLFSGLGFIFRQVVS